jgi:tetratricopeptide (TPR) repeat protein
VHEFVDGSILRAGVSIRPCGVPVHHYGRLDRAKTEEKGEAYYLLGRKKLDERAEDPKALYELGVQAAELGKYEEAVGLWQRLLSVQPDDPLALFNLGYSLLKLGKFDECLDASRRALERDPDLKEAVLNYANAELYVGEVPRAVAVLERTLSRLPDYPPAEGLLAAAYYIEGKKEKGLELFSKLRARGFDCAEFLHDLAETLVNAGRTEYALTSLEAAVKSNNVRRAQSEATNRIAQSA